MVVVIGEKTGGDFLILPKNAAKPLHLYMRIQDVWHEVPTIFVLQAKNSDNFQKLQIPVYNQCPPQGCAGVCLDSKTGWWDARCEERGEKWQKKKKPKNSLLKK